MAFLKIIIFTICMFLSRSHSSSNESYLGECKDRIFFETCIKDKKCIWNRSKCVREMCTRSNLTIGSLQEFAGIVSGGTSLPVRGKGFLCVKNPKIIVQKSQADCLVKNDTYMVCLSPRSDEVKSPTKLHSGFVMDLEQGGTGAVLTGFGYRLFPDPEFTGFKMIDGIVVLYGNHLGSGYRPRDVFVTFQNHHPAVSCDVILMTRDRIECKPTVDLKDLNQVLVTVGRTYRVTLCKIIDLNDHLLSTVMEYSCITIIILTMILVACIFFLCLKINKQRLNGSWI